MSPQEPDSDYFLIVFNAIPVPAFTVDEDVRIQNFNRVAGTLFGSLAREILGRRGGEVLHCLHSTEAPEGCGQATACSQCVIRNSVKEAIGGGGAWRQPTSVDLIAGQAIVKRDLLVTASPFTYQGRHQVLLVLEDITEQKQAEEARLEQELLRGVIEMAGAAAHELSQPLQVLVGAIDYLKSLGLSDDLFAEQMAALDQALERTLTVIRKIQRVTRYEAKPYVGTSKIIDLDKASG